MKQKIVFVSFRKTTVNRGEKETFVRTIEQNKR